MLEADARQEAIRSFGDLEATRCYCRQQTEGGQTAIGLSVVGLYGVTGYYVQQSLMEIGIRIALGGRPARVVRLIVGEGMTWDAADSSSASSSPRV
jgi:hypothetical protein